MELERCDNCKRDIPSVNFVMHFAHCRRNIETCNQCGEPVPKTSWEDHQEQFHKPVKCEMCGNQIPKARLENHIENSCLQRTVDCVFCGLQMSFSELNDHEVYCGSRTEPCGGCRKYVMIKDLENHICGGSHRSNSTQSVDEEFPVTVPCEFCDMQVAVNDLMKHQSICQVSSDDDVEILDDINYHSFQREGQSPNRQEIPTRNHSTASDEVTDGCQGEDKGQAHNAIYALPCECCGELYPSDKLMQHQEDCLPNTDDRPSSHSTDDHLFVDDDDNNWYIGAGVQWSTRRGTRPSQGLDVFDVLMRFHPFFSRSVFEPRI